MKRKEYGGTSVSTYIIGEEQMINDNSNEVRIPSLQGSKDITNKLRVHIRDPISL
jgi:hypothetical protein